MEAQWQGDLDNYGSFCITIPSDQTLAIVNKLNASNDDWERRALLNPQAARNLNVRQTIGYCAARDAIFLLDNRRPLYRQEMCPSSASSKSLPS